MWLLPALGPTAEQGRQSGTDHARCELGPRSGLEKQCRRLWAKTPPDFLHHQLPSSSSADSPQAELRGLQGCAPHFLRTEDKRPFSGRTAVRGKTNGFD